MKTCLSYREPLFATYHYLASHGVVAQENPTGIRWFFNHAVGLSCSGAFQKGYSSPKLSVFPYGVLADGNLDTYIVNICFSPEDSLKIIKRMIDAGYYVLFDHVDDYYLDILSSRKDRFYTFTHICFRIIRRNGERYKFFAHVTFTSLTIKV